MSTMIFLLGASGYVGDAFQRELTRRGLSFKAISRAELDYSQFRVLTDALKSHRPRLVINCGGFTGKPNVDACEAQRTETICGNIVLAQTIAQACDATGRSNCLLHSAKLATSGIKIRDVETALADSIRHWVKAGPA